MFSSFKAFEEALTVAQIEAGDPISFTAFLTGGAEEISGSFVKTVDKVGNSDLQGIAIFTDIGERRFSFTVISEGAFIN